MVLFPNSIFTYSWILTFVEFYLWNIIIGLWFFTVFKGFYDLFILEIQKCMARSQKVKQKTTNSFFLKYHFSIILKWHIQSYLQSVLDAIFLLILYFSVYVYLLVFYESVNDFAYENVKKFHNNNIQHFILIKYML